MIISIEVDVDPGDGHVDEGDHTGLTLEAYERLTDPMSGPLLWLGEVQDVTKLDIPAPDAA